MLLFRKEALEAQQVSALGRILLFTPRIADVLIALVLLFTFLLLLFVIFGSYTRKATVYGELVPVSGVIKVYPPQGGRIEAVEVQSGARVAKGAVLARINSAVDTAGGDTQARVLAALQAQHDALQENLGRNARAQKEYAAQMTGRREALAKAFIEADSLGATVTLSSHLKNPVTGGSAFDTSKVDVQRLISGDLQSKLHDWLDTVATAANNAVRADGSKIPVIFRPLHENTGDWFWWGKGHMSADDYKTLWQHIHQYLDSKGAHNLLYAYSPNGSLDGDKSKYLEAYPGDKYVDVFGYDAYQSEP